jgi:ABC-type transporter Mla subunit MlaD
MSRQRPSRGHSRAMRARRRELWLGGAVIAVVALAGWLSTIAINGLPWSSAYVVRVALPAGAPLLHGGDEVRVGGERVGQVRSVTLVARGRALATLALDSGKVGPGASARIRPRGLAGAVYVDLTPGRVRSPLRSGSVIRGTGAVQLTDVISGFDADARRAMGQVLTGYGTGLAGRGVGLGQVISAAPPLLSDLTVAMQALRPQPGTLARGIGDAGTVAGALAQSGALAGVVSAASQVLQTTALHARALGDTIGALPAVERATAAVLPGANALLGEVRSASSDLAPGVAALTRALPGLQALEHDGPAVSELASVAGHAAPVLRVVTPLLARVGGPASGLTPLSTPVAELASVLIPYGTELREAPLGFTRWGNFTYDFGTGAGHRAVRFSMVLTCALARDPYPLPGAASKERKPCP